MQVIKRLISTSCQNRRQCWRHLHRDCGTPERPIRGPYNQVRYLIVALLALCSLAHGQTLVQCANGNANGPASSVTTNITTSAGSFLVSATQEITDNTTTWTQDDSSGSNTWTQTTSGYASNGTGQNMRMDVRSSPNAVAVTSVTSHFSGSISSLRMVVCEFTGMVTSSPEDTSVNSAGSGFVTSLTSGSYTTSKPNDLLVYVVDTAGLVTAPTAGTGFTIPANATNSGTLMLQYEKINSLQASQTTSMTWTTGARADSVFGAFLGASSGVRKPLVF
jgi:hypothetical protein